VGLSWFFMSVISEDLGRRRSLYRLAVARTDIGSARAVARYASAHVREFTDELWLPLQDAIIISYARPFSSNEPFGPIPARWRRFDNPSHQQLHDELIRSRNELVAHADASTRSVTIFPPNTRPPVPGLEPRQEPTLAVHHYRRPPAFFESVRDLCEDLLPRLHVAVQQELRALFGDVPAVQPFNLLTGEEYTVDVSGAIVLSGEQLPPEWVPTD
jgi:hypothetical protein